MSNVAILHAEPRPGGASLTANRDDEGVSVWFTPRGSCYPAQMRFTHEEWRTMILSAVTEIAKRSRALIAAEFEAKHPEPQPPSDSPV